MGLFNFFLGLFGWQSAAPSEPRRDYSPSPRTAAPPTHASQSAAATTPPKFRVHGRRPVSKPRLVRLRRQKKFEPRTPLSELTVSELPYAFARLGVLGGYLDLSRDGDLKRLRQFDLPVFSNPVELAEWLGISVGRLAWLTHRCEEGQRPKDPRSAHYHFRWLKKRKGGFRLIEAPKPLLKTIQQKILREILDKIPVHSACHGFTLDRSIRTNAMPHTGKRVVVKLDLENFYSTVSHSRIVAIFRSLGYSREASIWLTGLTTAAIPNGLEAPNNDLYQLYTYRGRHLPQGAPTSPTLANLSAFSLDLRLAGLARSYRAQYTRYADDLTFSGSQNFLNGLQTFLQLVAKIIKAERFLLHPNKRQVLRNNQQQKVTGVVVNSRVNIDREDFDRLKALLHNCLTRGVSTQNHEHREDFPQHVLGRIGHVKMLNPVRGEKLLGMYRQVDWKS